MTKEKPTNYYKSNCKGYVSSVLCICVLRYRRAPSTKLPQGKSAKHKYFLVFSSLSLSKYCQNNLRPQNIYFKFIREISRWTVQANANRIVVRFKIAETEFHTTFPHQLSEVTSFKVESRSVIVVMTSFVIPHFGRNFCKLVAIRVAVACFS